MQKRQRPETAPSATKRTPLRGGPPPAYSSSSALKGGNSPGSSGSSKKKNPMDALRPALARGTPPQVLQTNNSALRNGGMESREPSLEVGMTPYGSVERPIQLSEDTVAGRQESEMVETTREDEGGNDTDYSPRIAPATPEKGTAHKDDKKTSFKRSAVVVAPGENPNRPGDTAERGRSRTPERGNNRGNGVTPDKSSRSRDKSPNSGSRSTTPNRERSKSPSSPTSQDKPPLYRPGSALPTVTFSSKPTNQRKPNGPTSHARLSPLVHVEHSKSTTRSSSSSASSRAGLNASGTLLVSEGSSGDGSPLSSPNEKRKMMGRASGLYRLLCIQSAVVANSAVLKILTQAENAFETLSETQIEENGFQQVPTLNLPQTDKSTSSSGTMALNSSSFSQIQLPPAFAVWSPNAKVFTGEPKNSVEEANLAESRKQQQQQQRSSLARSRSASPSRSAGPLGAVCVGIGGAPVVIPKLGWQHRFYIFPTITILDFSNFMLGSFGCQPIFALLKHMECLEKLNLKGNNISNEAVFALVDDVLTCVTYSVVTTADHPISLEGGGVGGTRERRIMRHPYLHWMDFSDNLVATAGGKHLFSWLCNTGSPQVTTLILTGEMVNAGLSKRFAQQCEENERRQEEEGSILREATSESVTVGGVLSLKKSSSEAGWFAPSSPSRPRSSSPAPRSSAEERRIMRTESQRRRDSESISTAHTPEDKAVEVTSPERNITPEARRVKEDDEVVEVPKEVPKPKPKQQANPGWVWGFEIYF